VQAGSFGVRARQRELDVTGPFGLDPPEAEAGGTLVAREQEPALTVGTGPRVGGPVWDALAEDPPIGHRALVTTVDAARIHLADVRACRAHLFGVGRYPLEVVLSKQLVCRDAICSAQLAVYDGGPYFFLIDHHSGAWYGLKKKT